MSFIQIAGNITEPELKFTKSGDALAKFGLCEVRKKGEEKVNTWYNVVVFGAMAENLCASSLKGRRLVVTGRLESDDWVDKEGNKKASMQFIADEVALSMRWDPINGSGASEPAVSYSTSEEPF
jgi:single-strand DNA-binding protein